jgi:putative protease
MDLKNINDSEKKKPLIVSPAGNLEKLKFAVKYGADNIYFGGEGFNLRVQADNFTFPEILEGVKYCRERGVKTTFLMNSFLHENQLKDAENYALKVKDLGCDSVMISDPGMLMILKDAGIEADFHLSTQMSTLNHRSAKFWLDAGFKRIVLAREVTLDEIREIKRNCDAEIEIFAHGALCIAYSGRCLLSRYLSGRDANGGDCSQPCRWKYSLMEEKRPGLYLDIMENRGGTEILSSKDLCLIERIEEYADAGVDAFKIEGRMKSLYHAANTTRIYRHAVNLAGTDGFSENLPFWLKELDLINHRPYTSDLFNEFHLKGYDGVPYINKALFVAYRADEGECDEIMVKTFNPMYPGEKLECIYPIGERVLDKSYIVEKIYLEDQEIEMARPNSIYRIKLDSPVFDDAIFRRPIYPKEKN